ncbi:MAG: hypothetical protein WAZ18_02355 [Alphaproteobacteria bacterium]
MQKAVNDTMLTDMNGHEMIEILNLAAHVFVIGGDVKFRFLNGETIMRPIREAVMEVINSPFCDKSILDKVYVWNPFLKGHAKGMMSVHDDRQKFMDRNINRAADVNFTTQEM